VFKKWASNGVEMGFVKGANAVIVKAIGYYLAFVTRALRVN
jgi:hypothetical protein